MASVHTPQSLPLAGSKPTLINTDIAHYVTNELFPRVEIAIDLHAGGVSFDHLPTMLAAMPRDQTRQAYYRQLVHAFAAPRTTILDMLGEDRTFAAAAEDAGVLFLGGEFGGGGRCDPIGVRIIEDGLSRVLHHLRVIPDETPPTARNDGQLLKVEGAHQYVFAPRAGIFEPEFALGDRVACGQQAGRLYDPYFPWNPPEEVVFNGQGTVMCARTFARVEPGDCIAVLASDMASTDF